jgi:diguanylate cyclase (GGDEF)-like protein
MPPIDPRTVIVLTGVMSGLMSLVLYSLTRNYPASIKGLREWSAGLFVLFLAGVLTAVRGQIPDLLSITLANLLLISGLYLGYFGSQRFFGVKPRPAPWLVLIGLMLLGQIWFTHNSPNYYARLVMVNVVAAALFGIHAMLVSRQGVTSIAKAITFGVLVFMALIQLMRMVAVYFFPISNGLMDTAPHHVIYITSFAFATLLFSIGLVLMASDKLHREFEHLATHDSLTNALTRRRMNDVCQQELHRCRRNGGSMALLVMDLDHFKSVNDNHGHQAGDQVLVNFAAKVNGMLRQADQLGRFGGEEFLLLLPESSLDEAVLVAERIRALSAVNPDGISCTVSIGVATNHAENDTVESILARADSAMYRAKANGRNRVETG